MAELSLRPRASEGDEVTRGNGAHVTGPAGLVVLFGGGPDEAERKARSPFKGRAVALPGLWAVG